MFRIKGVQKISVTPGEVFLRQPKFIIEFEEAVAPTPVVNALQVKGFRGRIRQSKRGRQVEWVPEEPLPVGRHHLVLGETVLAGGKKVSYPGEIPFSIVGSKARVGTSFKVYGFVRRNFGAYSGRGISIHAAAKGNFIEFLKVQNVKTGKWGTMAFDASGKQLGYESTMRRLLSADTRRYGKLQPALLRVMTTAKKSTAIPVAIIVAAEGDLTTEEGTRLKNSSEKTIPKAVKDLRTQWAAAVKPVARRITELGKIKVTADHLAPVVYAQLNKNQINAIKALKSVAGIYHLARKAFDDLDDSVSISNADDAHSVGFEGKAIDVAVWEPGPDVVTELIISGEYDTSTGAATSSHARLTHAVIKNSNTRNASTGYAPSCNLYSANSYDLDALRWAVKDIGCTVISQSFHRDAEQTSDSLSYDDIYKDWLILHWPYPTIAQAAGNGATSTEYVNHKGYNGLVVGSHNDSATAMASDSILRNPASAHGDRELPEICANGTGVSSCGVTMGGTSFAAPAVAGAAAVIQGVDTILRRWPEGCRAILMAAAETNVKDNSWWRDVSNSTDGADGSGALNVLHAVRITQSRKGRNNAASRRGWDIGTLTPGDFGPDGLGTFSYFVNVPDYKKRILNLLGPRHVKVVLAWNSKSTSIFNIPIASRLGIDLDLHVLDSNGNYIALSQSWDNSYEIVDFNGVPGETYEIKIRWFSGTGSTWFGIAWSVTGGFTLTQIRERDLASLYRHLELG